ncbi:porin [Arcobacter sp.]|uniref:porin n=1 Tax=unclassified Arcobacter TaxID=2593671 RepID=UPI003B005791|eukprot:TRINITY_DN2292_c0_g1_i2.p1 TRINITY_DN2292_c0_g1~~TRINITY_DN2292_c0_g1_i2.p1  ORF type:complete len:394 (-),score=-20.25 TRINITY_DN2292_c0_g1_i2:125-1306(-)
MKKFVKMSLIAAIAVAGTTASAQPLTEAIKNVDVSGTMVYRYNDYGDDKQQAGTGHSDTNNYYKIGVSLKSKVNDDVTANTRFVMGKDGNTGDKATLDTQAIGDQNVNVELTNANFAYTGIANTTVIVGKQGLTTPWTVAVDAAGNEQTGTGILALTTVGPVTIAGAYFNQTNVGESGNAASTLTALTYGNSAAIGSRDVYTIGVMGKVGPVALDAWYIDMEDTFDSYTLGANASFDFDAVTLGGDIRYTSLDLEKHDLDNNLLKLTLTAKAGIFDAKVAYATTDDEGGVVALDADAATQISAWTVDANNKADADYWQVRLGFQVLPSLNISANYADVDYAGNIEEEEYYAQFNYSMSKNLSAYLRYGQYTKDTGSTENNDSTRGRIHVQYKF